MRDEPLSAQGEKLLDADHDRHDEAIDVLRRAVAGREPSAPGLLARAYLDRGDLHLVVALLVPRVRAGRTDLAFPLAEALAGTRDFERAELAFQRAVVAGEVPAMVAFGVFLRDRGRLREAGRMLRKAAEAGSDEAPRHLVAVHWELGEPELASATAAHWADEARPTTLHAQAFVHAAYGRYARAEELYRQAARLGAHRGHLEYAQFLVDALDDTDAAEIELELAEAGQEPGWAWAFGQFLVATGRVGEARAYLRHAAYWGSIEARQALEDLDGDPQDD
ncbi:MAG TPA: hypothetical protein VGH99_07155 [Pseudonocardia sp.]